MPTLKRILVRFYFTKHFFEKMRDNGVSMRDPCVGPQMRVSHAKGMDVGRSVISKPATSYL